MEFCSARLLILLLAATGMANRALARETLADGPATLAGCAAIFLGYALFSVYKRCDFAELAGGFWIPLLLLFALRRRKPTGNFRQRAFDGSAAPLALIVAGIWLSNGPVGIMAGYLLAAVALVSALLERSLAPVMRAAVSTLAGMGLASIYLIPAVWERNWASIQQYALTPVFLRWKPTGSSPVMPIRIWLLTTRCCIWSQRLQPSCLRSPSAGVRLRGFAAWCPASAYGGSRWNSFRRRSCFCSFRSRWRFGMQCRSCGCCSFPGAGCWFWKLRWRSVLPRPSGSTERPCAFP